MPKQRVIFQKLPEDLPPGFWTGILFGKTAEEFAQEILSNPGGKYDACYGNAKGRRPPNKKLKA